MELKRKYLKGNKKKFIGVSDALKDFMCDVIEDGDVRGDFYESLKQVNFKSIDDADGFSHGPEINFSVPINIDDLFYVIWGIKPDRHTTLLVYMEETDSDTFLDQINDSSLLLKFNTHE
jgi:hypothetical protein